MGCYQISNGIAIFSYQSEITSIKLKTSEKDKYYILPDASMQYFAITDCFAGTIVSGGHLWKNYTKERGILPGTNPVGQRRGFVG